MPDWRDLHHLLDTQVGPGQVTTYGVLSAHFYGNVGMRNQPIGSMLGALARRGHAALTRRVVAVDGALIPERQDGGAPRQRAALLAEGVPFTADGKVDLRLCPPIAF